MNSVRILRIKKYRFHICFHTSCLGSIPVGRQIAELRKKLIFTPETYEVIWENNYFMWWACFKK